MRARETSKGAGKSTGENRAELMAEAAVVAADNRLLDRAHIALDADQYAKFLDLLGQGPEPEGFKRLMDASAPWRP